MHNFFETEANIFNTKIQIFEFQKSVALVHTANKILVILNIYIVMI